MANKEVEPLVPIETIAERLTMKVSGVKNLVYRKVIPVVRIGHRTLRFHWSEVETALARYRQAEIH